MPQAAWACAHPGLDGWHEGEVVKER